MTGRYLTVQLVSPVWWEKWWERSCGPQRSRAPRARAPLTLTCRLSAQTPVAAGEIYTPQHREVTNLASTKPRRSGLVGQLRGRGHREYRELAGSDELQRCLYRRNSRFCIASMSYSQTDRFPAMGSHCQPTGQPPPGPGLQERLQLNGPLVGSSRFDEAQTCPLGQPVSPTPAQRVTQTAWNDHASGESTTHVAPSEQPSSKQVRGTDRSTQVPKLKPATQRFSAGQSESDEHDDSQVRASIPDSLMHFSPFGHSWSSEQRSRAQTPMEQCIPGAHKASGGTVGSSPRHDSPSARTPVG